MFSEFRVKTGQVTLMSTELQMFSGVRVKTGQVTLLSTEFQNVQWILSSVQGRTGDVTCH